MRRSLVTFQFKALPWQHIGPGGWYFASLPEDLSKKIRSLFKDEEQGWGRMKAIARIGHTKWDTAIWFDTKRNCYLLPLKKEIRTRENLQPGRSLSISISI